VGSAELRPSFRVSSDDGRELETGCGGDEGRVEDAPPETIAEEADAQGTTAR
jgi:hypothetical protein